MITKLYEISKKVAHQLGAIWSGGLVRFQRYVEGWTRHRIQKEPIDAVQATLLDQATRSDLQSTLDGIVYDVVETLGYMAAMVATYDQGDTLVVRAYYFHRDVLNDKRLKRIEAVFSSFADRPISLSNPEVARSYVFRDGYENNLSVIAAKQGSIVVSDELFSLLTPIAPDTTAPLARIIQQVLGIRQVIAVPFFLETSAVGKTEKEMVGNLYAIKKRDVFTDKDIQVLSAFARRTAAAILSERRRRQIEIAQSLVYNIQTSLQDEEMLLQHIVTGVVEKLEYVMSLVTTCEYDGSLVLRAHAVDSTMTQDYQRKWNEQVNLLKNRRINLASDVYEHNIGIRAAKSHIPQFSPDLFNIFVPFVPPETRLIIENLQRHLDIHQLIAVPFFLEAMPLAGWSGEFVGILFAVTRSRRFSNGEIELLQTFAQQAAAGLYNAKLYRQSEDRQLAAQIFGKMAFSASASVHALKNHIGAIRLSLQLTNMAIKTPDVFSEEKRRDLLANLDKGSSVFNHIDTAADVLDTLHEPWNQKKDEEVNVSACIERAVNKILPGGAEWVHVELSHQLPSIYTSVDMLTEVFKVLIKNAVEAIEEGGKSPELVVASGIIDESMICVVVKDNGIGIPEENRAKIFEIGWSTKRSGLGFGLFWVNDYVIGLGGQIVVESKLNVGTTFRVLIPVTNQRKGISYLHRDGGE